MRKERANERNERESANDFLEAATTTTMERSPSPSPILPLTKSHAADQQGRDDHALDHF